MSPLNPFGLRTRTAYQNTGVLLHVHQFTSATLCAVSWLFIIASDLPKEVGLAGAVLLVHALHLPVRSRPEYPSSLPHLTLARFGLRRLFTTIGDAGSGIPVQFLYVNAAFASISPQRRFSRWGIEPQFSTFHSIKKR